MCVAVAQAGATASCIGYWVPGEEALDYARYPRVGFELVDEVQVEQANHFVGMALCHSEEATGQSYQVAGSGFSVEAPEAQANPTGGKAEHLYQAVM